MVESQAGAPLSAILDDVRPLIMAARDRGEHPRYLMLPQEPYAAVSACKARDRDKGIPILVLGLEVVPADEPLDAPRVF